MKKWMVILAAVLSCGHSNTYTMAALRHGLRRAATVVQPLRVQVRNAHCHDVLGISEKATEKEIKTAYLRLAKKYHPDANPNNTKQAAEKFKKIGEAKEQALNFRKNPYSQSSNSYTGNSSSYSHSRSQNSEYKQSYKQNNKYDTDKTFYQFFKDGIKRERTREQHREEFNYRFRTSPRFRNGALKAIFGIFCTKLAVGSTLIFYPYYKYCKEYGNFSLLEKIQSLDDNYFLHEEKPRIPQTAWQRITAWITG